MDYLKAFVGLTLGQHLFDSYMTQRQLKKLDHSSPPSSLRSYFALLGDSSNFLPSQHYLRDKLRFGQLASVIDLFENAAIYTTIVSSLFGSASRPISGLKGVWDYAGTFVFVSARGQIVQSLAFCVCISAIGMITSIPASLYRTFVLEEKVRINCSRYCTCIDCSLQHGFNKTTARTWILDLVKSQVLSATLGLPLIAALLKLIEWAGPSFVTYTMVFILGIQIVMIPVYPYLIAPIFNKYKNLSEFKDKENYMEVQKRVEALSGRLEFPLGKLWVMDGSTRSSHS